MLKNCNVLKIKYFITVVAFGIKKKLGPKFVWMKKLWKIKSVDSIG